MSNILGAEDETRSRLRIAAYAILCTMSLATMCGRIIQVRSEHGTPFLSANDRSRWCTIRALVDERTYAIDSVHKIRGWHTIDKVYHPDKNGIKHFYSSKPTLLPTLLAAQYWLIQQATGETLESRPFYIGRLMLVLTNVLPMALYYVFLATLIEKWGTTDFGRIFAMAVATFGTFLTTFSVTLNNHLPAAISVIVALWAANALWYERRTSFWLFPLAGLGAAFAAANELPALSFLALLGFGLLFRINGDTALSFVVSIVTVLIVAAGFFGTNYIAHNDLRPPYMHRSEDDPTDNWYAYEGSHWLKQDKGIDNGEPSRRVYAMNVLVGHHGIFSLTPVWLLSIVGGLVLIFGKKKRLAFAVLVATLSAVCIGFYLLRPQMDRNYGGVTCGLRWAFWLIPMWTLALVPAADIFGRRRATAALAVALLAASVFSATYACLNPWTHPWIYQYWQYIEYI